MDYEKLDSGVSEEPVELDWELDYFMKRGAYCVYWNGVLVKAPTLEKLKEKITKWK